MKIDFKKIKNNLMTGISYMIPLTVIGGICYAGAIALGGTAVEGQGMVVTNEILLHLQEIGSAGLFLMIPILCGYIAYAVAGKPALAPGFVVGYLCNTEITIDFRIYYGILSKGYEKNKVAKDGIASCTDFGYSGCNIYSCWFMLYLYFCKPNWHWDECFE